MDIIEIPQNFIGRVNVVGDCFCMGLVTDRRAGSYKQMPVYISLTGAATSIESVWAKLSQGKEFTVLPDGKGYPVYMQAPKGGLYTRFQKKIPELGIDHLILMHDSMAVPEYPGADNGNKSTIVYMLYFSDEHRMAKFGEHITKALKIAVFPEWFEFLYTEGRSRGLVRDCAGHGVVQAITLGMDVVRWTALIADGLRWHKIDLPAVSTP